MATDPGVPIPVEPANPEKTYAPAFQNYPLLTLQAPSIIPANAPTTGIFLSTDFFKEYLKTF